MSDCETSDIEFSEISSSSPSPEKEEILKEIYNEEEPVLKTKNKSTQATTQRPKGQRGRPRKYETTQERINAISKKQCAEKKEKTKIKHKLIKEGHQNQFQLINKLQINSYEIDYINEILKNIDKHEIKQN